MGFMNPLCDIRTTCSSSDPEQRPSNDAAGLERVNARIERWMVFVYPELGQEAGGGGGPPPPSPCLYLGGKLFGMLGLEGYRVL